MLYHRFSSFFAFSRCLPRSREASEFTNLNFESRRAASDLTHSPLCDVNDCCNFLASYIPYLTPIDFPYKCETPNSRLPSADELIKVRQQKRDFWRFVERIDPLCLKLFEIPGVTR